MLDFYNKHPEFGKHALFCVVATEAFHQPRWAKQKLEFLLDQGMEIANHTFCHQSLSKATPEDINTSFGKAIAYWEKQLGKRAQEIKFIAPPYGALPLSPSAFDQLSHFTWCNKSYEPLGILMAGRKYTHVCPLPSSKEFNRYALPSIEITANNFDTILKSII